METKVDVARTYTLVLDDYEMSTLRKILTLAEDQMRILPDELSNDPVVSEMTRDIRRLREVG